MKKTDVTYLNTQNLTKAIKLKPELPYLVMIKQGLDMIAVLNYGNGKKSCFNFPNSESTLGKELGNIELGLVLPKKKKDLVYLFTEKDGSHNIWEIGGSKDGFPVFLTLYAQISNDKLIMLNIIEDLGKKDPLREHIVLTMDHKDFFATEIFSKLACYLPTEDLLPHIGKTKLIDEKAGE